MLFLLGTCYLKARVSQQNLTIVNVLFFLKDIMIGKTQNQDLTFADLNSDL